MKFQYSPGLIGYGAKGADGSSGLQGLAMYFTDFNPLSDIIAVRSAIENNEVLWSTAIPGTKLPGGRKYSFDDLFIDSRGFLYRITNPATGDYISTGMALNKSTFFQSNTPAVLSDNGFLRYFNKQDPSLRFIIDNVFTDIAGINYSLSPSKIYGIAPRNFNRIEYSNITDVSYNAFTLYSSGENVITDDNKSIAIVREISPNNFHLGNLDSNNLFRDVDLILDVSSLMFKREVGNQFNKNTVSGTILTNAEINPNELFDNGFNSLPGSFMCATAPTHVTLNWVLSDFCNDPCSGILYFYPKEDASGSFNIDASMTRPLVFHNVGNSGSLIISALTLGKIYEYYMRVCKNGWERNSILRQVTTANTPALFNILNPSPPTLTAEATGRFIPSLIFKYPVSIFTDSFTGWNLTDIPKPDWISTLVTASPPPGIPITGGPGPGTYNFDVSLSAYNGYLPRSGNITFTSEAPTQVLSITQNRRPARTNTVRMVTYVDTISDAKGRLVFNTPLDPGQVVTITGHLHVKSSAHGGSHNITDNHYITLYKNGVQQFQVHSTAHSTSGTVYGYGELDFTLSGIINGDIIEVRQGPTFDCWYFTSGANGWAEGAGWMRIDSVTDGWDTFDVTSLGQQYWNVTRISCGTCSTNCYFDSWTDNAGTLLP